ANVCLPEFVLPMGHLEAIALGASIGQACTRAQLCLVVDDLSIPLGRFECLLPHIPHDRDFLSADIFQELIHDLLACLDHVRCNRRALALGIRHPPCECQCRIHTCQG